jgi:hypothetical protein
MSTHTATAPAAPAADTPRRSSPLRWIGAGSGLAALLGVAAIALWPASEADKARADGERVGEAVTQLYYADSSAEVDAALSELDAAVADTRAHAGDELTDQLDDQADALARAADGFAGSRTTDDAFEADLYQAELDIALDDLTNQASDFRAQGPEVHQAFAEGLDTGLTIE